MNQNKKKALALATVVSFVVANPLAAHGEEKTTKQYDKDYEKDDAYHGTWEKSFIFPEDKDEEIYPKTSGGTYVHYSSRPFRVVGWNGWNRGYGSYSKYKTYKENATISSGKGSIKSSSSSSSSSGGKSS